MAGKAKPVPEGYHTLTPHLAIRDAARAVDFYKRAFGAKEIGVHKTPDGKIMHAELKIGDSVLMFADEFPGSGVSAPQALGGTTTQIHIYVEDVDKLFNQAVGAGATVKMPLMDAFWGDRYGQVTDPFGHAWSLATHQRDVSREEMEKAGAEFFAKMSKAQHAS